MSIHLQKVRLFVTTSNRSSSGTDSDVFFYFYVPDGSFTTYPDKGWRSVEIDNPGDDRERGDTDLYEVDFTIGDIGVNISGTNVPRGIGYANFVDVHGSSFWLRMGGSDMWRANHYHLLGYFKELRYVPGTIDSFAEHDLGWRLMASRDNDFTMNKIWGHYTYLID